jgi:hypothetical protein
MIVCVKGVRSSQASWLPRPFPAPGDHPPACRLPLSGPRGASYAKQTKRRSAARTGACVGGVRGYLAQISLSAPSQLATEGTHTIGRMGDSQGEHGGFAQDTGGQER